MQYSGGSKTEHLKTNAILLPNVLKVGFRMFGFRMVDHSKTERKMAALA